MHNAYQQLAEAQAIRLHGHVTARHPAAFPLQGLLQLRSAAARYGYLLGNRERVSFADWAQRIASDALAGIDTDRDALVAALRAMHQAAQPPPPSAGLAHALRRWAGTVKLPRHQGAARC